MSVTAGTIVKGVKPDITESAFVGFLREKGSPALSAGARIYRYCVQRGLSPAFLAGMYWEESRAGTDPNAICVGGGGAFAPTFSLGNTTEPSYGDPGLGPPFVRGRFTRYAGWYEGGISTVARLFEHPPYDGKATIAEIIRVWAPSIENRTEEYIAGVVATMNRLGATPQQGTGGTTVAKLALAAGHHNRDGGNPYEYETTGLLTPRIAAACRRLGMDVRVVTPGDGAGQHAGGIWDVADEVCRWAREGWVADVFLETHTQGVNDPSVRGVFGIYPDWGDDVDGDARDALIPLVVDRVCEATGFPKWSTGLMSEKRTGVGISGYRLGILNRTAPIRATTTRFLIEYGAHSNPVERAAHRTDAFLDGAARGTAEGIAEFLGLSTAVTPPAPPDEAAALKAWVGETVPYAARGDLTREGVVDLSEFQGKADEWLAVYERLVAHRLRNENYVLTLDLYDRLRAEGKITLY